MMKFGKPPKQGKKTSEWNAAREQLKRLFQSRGLTRCEICWADWSVADLGFAHSKKRRHIEGSEIYEVILACNYPCHAELERKPEDEMTAAVRTLIAARGWDAAQILK